MIRILLAEDQAMVRGALGALLKMERDIEVLGAAADGMQALSECRRLKPDIVVTDIEMPGMTGIELAKEIRRHHFDLPVVLTSGYSQVLAQNGSYGFELLQKPYSIEQLSRILHKVGRWRSAKRGAAE